MRAAMVLYFLPPLLVIRASPDPDNVRPFQLLSTLKSFQSAFHVLISVSGWDWLSSAKFVFQVKAFTVQSQ